MQSISRLHIAARDLNAMRRQLLLFSWAINCKFLRYPSGGYIFSYKKAEYPQLGFAVFRPLLAIFWTTNSRPMLAARGGKILKIHLKKYTFPECSILLNCTTLPSHSYSSLQTFTRNIYSRRKYRVFGKNVWLIILLSLVSHSPKNFIFRIKVEIIWIVCTAII